MNAIKILVSLFICLIALPVAVGSEVQAPAFVKKVEGAGRVSAAVQTTDGSYVSISDTGDTSCFVRKISNKGKRIWERTLSFEVGDGFVIMNGIAETNDGYVLVGWGRLAGYYDDDSDVLVKLGTDGTVQWTKTFSAPGLFDSVFATADGGYIIQGKAGSRTILLKFSSDHNVVFAKSFEHSCCSLSQGVSDGFVLASGVHRVSNESKGLRVLKLNDSGRVVWKKLLKIKGFRLHALGAASENGVVLAGKSSNSNTLILVGLNAIGELHWKASYSLKVHFYISSLKQTLDGGYVITGTKSNPETGGNIGGFVLRIDAKQNLVFQKTFGLSDTKEGAESVFATAEGGFTVFGTVFGSRRRNDMLILNLNSDGDVPGCRFLQTLAASKVASPNVTLENPKIVFENFQLSTKGSIQIDSVESKKLSSNACP